MLFNILKEEKKMNFMMKGDGFSRDEERLKKWC